MNGQGKRLMVMAGGIGGRVFPGLAVAHHLMAQDWQARWLGAADRMEMDLVPKHGIEINFIRISGLRGKDTKALIVTPSRIFDAQRQARATMKAYKPDMVLGMGGCISGPGGLAVQLLGIPIVLREQSGIAGLTGKWLAKIATKVMQTFPGVFPNAEVVGNPMRIDVLALPLPQQRLAGREGPIRALVVGGSQGARILDQTIPQVVVELGDSVTIRRQNGKGLQQSAEQAYTKVGQPQHRATEFIDDMVAAYAQTDVVAYHSGALTMNEIAAAGLPTLFVPFQHKDRQQYWNALPLGEADVAKTIEQPQLNADAVANTLAGQPREILLIMAGRARAAPILDATEQMANEVSRAARA